VDKQAAIKYVTDSVAEHASVLAFQALCKILISKL
jgi:hypothetical protein